MARQSVGTGMSMSTGVLSGVTTSFHIQSPSVRITARDFDAHVVISQASGVSTTADTSDYLILADTSDTLALSRYSCKIIAITQEDGCTLTCPEGMQVPFNIGNYVTLKGASENLYNQNIVHSRVTSVDTTAGYDGAFQTKLTVDADTSGISTAFTSVPANSDVTLYSSARIGARSEGGAGSIFAIQVQTTGDA
tara:strand:+ start:196 stop:777 length:582 start_codon:yes stop_codon:yes gene_type:complete